MAEIINKATRESFGMALAEAAKEYPQLVVLDADLAKATRTDLFKAACPERFVDCGISECNMIGVAAGLASCGKIPVPDSGAGQDRNHNIWGADCNRYIACRRIFWRRAYGSGGCAGSKE